MPADDAENVVSAGTSVAPDGPPLALIVKAPDEQVRRAVEDLFAELARTGSA